MFIFDCLWTCRKASTKVLGFYRHVFLSNNYWQFYRHLLLLDCPEHNSSLRVFIINLALSDLLVGFVVLSLSAVFRVRVLIRLNNQSNDYDSNLECDISKTVGFFALFLSGVSLNSIAVIAVDRYLGFSLHLRYHAKLVTAKRALIVRSGNCLDLVFAYDSG